MKRLRALVKEGKSEDELMAELDLKERAPLQEALMEIERQKGENVRLKGTVGKPSLNARYSGGGIRIDPSMLQGSRFVEGDEFEISVSDDGISLKPITGKYGPPKT